ncbi:MAG: phasin family protein [Pseudomonadota bacterium]
MFNTDFAKSWQTFTESTTEAYKDLEALNMGVLEKLTGKQIEFATFAFETTNRSLSAATESSDYQAMLATQTKLGNELNEKFIAATKETADIIAESREAYQGWLENEVKRWSEASATMTTPS